MVTNPSRKRAPTRTRAAAERTPSSGTYRVAPSPAAPSTRDRRAVLAAKLRDLAAELHQAGIGADDLRLAADVVTALAFPVEHFESEELRERNERGPWIDAMIASLNVLARKWGAEKRWWLGAAERARLALAEAERHELAKRGVYR